LNLDELLGSLLLESGSEKAYHYYTDFFGLINILRSGYIKSGSTYSNLDREDRDQICVLRPSGAKDIESIAGEENTKNLVALFVIQFDIVNDKIHNLKVKPINKPVLSFERDIERILMQYNLLNKKKEIINDVEKYRDLFTISDYKKLHNKIYNYVLNLTNKEGEERIFINKLKIDSAYIKIKLLKKCLEIYDLVSLKDKGMFRSVFFDSIEYFEDNEVYKKFDEIFSKGME
jgi:hypothetical protein